MPIRAQHMQFDAFGRAILNEPELIAYEQAYRNVATAAGDPGTGTTNSSDCRNTSNDVCTNTYNCDQSNDEVCTNSAHLCGKEQER